MSDRNETDERYSARQEAMYRKLITDGEAELQFLHRFGIRSGASVERLEGLLGTWRKNIERLTPFVCSSDKPWNAGEKTPVVHPDAHKLFVADGAGEGPELARFLCPNCGSNFWRESP